MLNALKWGGTLSLVAAGLIGNYYFAEHSLLLRVIVLLAMGCAALALALNTTIGQRAWAFTQEARTELRKVVWPSRQETVQTSGIVLAMVVVMGLILWGIDTVLLHTLAWLTGYGAP